MGQVLLLDYKGQAAVVPCVELRKRFHSSPSVLLGVLGVVVGSAGDQAKDLTRVRQALYHQTVSPAQWLHREFTTRLVFVLFLLLYLTLSKNY